jgi:hypothetical protein
MGIVLNQSLKNNNTYIGFGIGYKYNLFISFFLGATYYALCVRMVGLGCILNLNSTLNVKQNRSNHNFIFYGTVSIIKYSLF